jgi:hypothetical protein
VLAFERVSSLNLGVHRVCYDDTGESASLLLAIRSYSIVGRISAADLAMVRRQAADSSKAAEAAASSNGGRSHTVFILCPEGLPVVLFLENVIAEVRRALRQADSESAPMTRGVSEEYGWRDRGWERGGSQFEQALTEQLRANGAGPIARRQTAHEAGVLAQRLSAIVMTRVDEEDTDAHQPSDFDDSASERLALGARVQALSRTGSKQWMLSTVVETPSCAAAAAASGGSSGARGAGHTVMRGVSVMYDDGRFETGVSAEQIRSLAPPPDAALTRRNPLAAVLLTFEQLIGAGVHRSGSEDAGGSLFDAMASELPASSGEQLDGRRVVHTHLSRSLSAFNLGRVSSVGHVELENGSGQVESNEGGTPESSPAQAAAGADVNRPGGGAGKLPAKHDAAAAPPSGRTLVSGAEVAMRLRVSLAHAPRLLSDCTGNRLSRAQDDEAGEASLALAAVDPHATVLRALHDLSRAHACRGGRAVVPELTRPGSVAHVCYMLEGVADAAPGACAGLGGVAEPLATATTAALPSDAPTPMEIDSDAVSFGASAEPRGDGACARARAVLACAAAVAPGSEPLHDALCALAALHALQPLGVQHVALAAASAAAREGGDGKSAPMAVPKPRDEVGSGTCARMLPPLCGVGPGADGASGWVCAPLDAKLNMQLADSTVVATGALPPWCLALTRATPFLFAHKSRLRHFRATAFGTSRSLAWAQDQLIATRRWMHAEELTAAERLKADAEASHDPQVSERLKPATT